MVNIQAAIVIGAVVVGAAVGGALFLLYPDVMLKGTSISSQSNFSPDGTTTAAVPDPSVGGYGAAQEPPTGP